MTYRGHLGARPTGRRASGDGDEPPPSGALGRVEGTDGPEALDLWHRIMRRPYRSRGPTSLDADRTRLQLAGFRMMAEREAERRAEAERREAARLRLEGR